MQERDWTGNGNSVWKNIGATNHSQHERPGRDFYATQPVAAEWLTRLETFSDEIWECASGMNHIADVFTKHGYHVRTSDIYPYLATTEVLDFLSPSNMGTFNGDIITNPPYKRAREFVEKALSLVGDGHKVAMFLKVTFLEGKARRGLFEKHPPKTVWVSSSRLTCVKNGRFDRYDKVGSAVAYAWFVWEKGYHGDTIVKWFN